MTGAAPRNLFLGSLPMAALLGCAAAQMPPSSPSRLLGQPAPHFARSSVQGGRIDSTSTGGRPVVVEFFALYCQPCQRRLPALERLHQAEPDLAVVGISLDESPEAALEQVRRFRLDFPVVHDAGRVLAGQFRVAELPAGFAIDRNGRVAWAGGPEQPQGALEQAARAALQDRHGGPAPAP